MAYDSFNTALAVAERAAAAEDAEPQVVMRREVEGRPAFEWFPASIEEKMRKAGWSFVARVENAR